MDVQAILIVPTQVFSSVIDVQTVSSAPYPGEQLSVPTTHPITGSYLQLKVFVAARDIFGKIKTIDKVTAAISSFIWL